MARPVDPQRHLARRLAIIDAALTCFAAEGFAGATTAAICRTAGIGSGTFFHYFPTKLDVLVAILELGTQETAEFFAAQGERDDPLAVVLGYVRHEADNLRDHRAVGFIRAVTAVLNEEPIATALAHHQRVVRAALIPWLRQARRQRTIRTDLSVDRTVSWLAALIDGFGGQIVEVSTFDANRETDVLLDLVRLFLTPPATT